MKAGAELTGRCAGSAPDCDEGVLALLASEGAAAVAGTALVICESATGGRVRRRDAPLGMDYYSRCSGEEW